VTNGEGISSLAFRFLLAHGSGHDEKRSYEVPSSVLRTLARRIFGPDEIDRSIMASMLRVEHEHRFDCSVETGFAYITDIANWPHYWPGFVRVEPGSRWSAPGDEAVVVVRLLGREVELRMTLSRLVPNQLVEYQSRQRGLPDAHHERHFLPENGGLRYRLVVEFAPRSGLRGLYDRVLVRRGIERALKQTVANLEERLSRDSRPEGSEPPSQT